MTWQALNQKCEGRNHCEGNYAGRGERENSRHVEVPAVIGKSNWNQQEDDDREQRPARAHRQPLRQRVLNERRREHRDKRGPAGFSKDFFWFFRGHRSRFRQAALTIRKVASVQSGTGIVSVLLDFPKKADDEMPRSSGPPSRMPLEGE